LRHFRLADRDQTDLAHPLGHNRFSKTLSGCPTGHRPDLGPDSCRHIASLWAIALSDQIWSDTS
jgi:hypothetical protein